MTNQWANRDSRIESADKHVAATLAAALIVRGTNMPGAGNMTVAADQAVEIYRFVLNAICAPGGRAARRVPE